MEAAFLQLSVRISHEQLNLLGQHVGRTFIDSLLGLYEFT